MPSPTSRLLTVLSLLQTRRDWPGSLLAARVGTSDRTVRRDVERLRELGYRIRSTRGPDGGYRLEPGDELPPLLFDDDQVLALTVALQSATVSGADVAEGALRALTTLRQVMPTRLRHRLDAVVFTPLAAPEHAAPTPVASLVAISTAIRAHETLRFDYVRVGAVGGPAAGPPRRADPHHLVASGGRWYLVAWDAGAADWRVFRVDRMSLRSATGGRFSPRTLPGGDAAAFVGARFRGFAGGDHGAAWPCSGTVVLGCPAADVAPFAADGIVEALDDRRCRLTAGAWSWIALASSLGRFDADIEVVGPPQLRAAFAELARRSARAAAASAEHAPDRRAEL